METIKNYEQAVEYLLEIPKFTGKNSLEDTKAFLQKLSDPEKNQKIIHIAGTNGKGSVCAYLRFLLMEAGFRVGTFTSPHLVEMNERIAINGIPIKKEDFLEVFCQVKGKLDGEYHPSFFEYLFFMAMLYFEKEKPDYVILETGLGGRLDATNSIDNPRVCVITSIGMDHMQYLGNTVEQIAGEKAGIIKAGVPVIYAADKEAVSRVIEDRATALGSLALPVSKKDYTFLNFKNKTIDFSYHSRYYEYVRLCLNTTAFYQMENASLALAAAELLLPDGSLTPERMQRAVFHARWAGRMEEVCPDVYVDGAHNEDGILAFLQSVARDGCRGHRRLIFGAVSDKAYTQIIQAITKSSLFFSIAVVSMDNGRALSADELKYTFNVQGIMDVSSFDTVGKAYEVFAAEQKEEDRIYIAGSLYLVGEFKGYLRMRGSHD